MTEIPSLNICSCHVLDPAKIRVLLWKRTKPNSSDDYYLLKIAEQRFIGLTRIDKKGEVYWKFKDFSEAEGLGISEQEFIAVEKLPRENTKENYESSPNNNAKSAEQS